MRAFKLQRNSPLAMFIGIANHRRQRCPALPWTPCGTALHLSPPFCLLLFFPANPSPLATHVPLCLYLLSACSEIVCLPSGLRVPASTHCWALSQAWESGGGGKRRRQRRSSNGWCFLAPRARSLDLTR